MTTEKNDDNMRPFLDILLCLICVLVAMLSLLHVKTEEVKDPSVNNNSVYKVVMEWDVKTDLIEGEQEDDVDLWVKDPNGNVCGFNRREGGESALMSLSHDDVGKNQTQTITKHIEIINLRGTVEGEYIVNCHYYARRGPTDSITVTARLVRQKPFKTVIERKVTINFAGDERTFFRFSLDKNAAVVDTNEMQAEVAVVSGDEDSTY